jgi:hypothetical protein
MAQADYKGIKIYDKVLTSRLVGADNRYEIILTKLVK